MQFFNLPAQVETRRKNTLFFSKKAHRQDGTGEERTGQDRAGGHLKEKRETPLTCLPVSYRLKNSNEDEDDDDDDELGMRMGEFLFCQDNNLLN